MTSDGGDRRAANDPVAVRLVRHATGIVVVIGVCWVLGAVGVFPGAAWVVPVVFLAVSLEIAVVYRLFPREDPLHANVRAAAQALGLTLVAYSTGWGFGLSMVHLFAVADNMDEGGSATTTTTLTWAAVGTILGQITVSVGLAPLAIDDVVTSHLLAGASFLLVFLVSRRMERTARAREEARTELLRREERFRALVEDAADVVLVLEGDFTVSWASPSTRRVLGRTVDVGQPYLGLVEEDDRPDVTALLAEATRSSHRRDPATFRLAGREGQITVEGTHRDLRANPAVAGYVASLRDVSERQALHAAVERSRTRDAGTGLPNRVAFEDHLHAVAAGGVEFAVLELRVVDLRAMLVADGPDAVDGLLGEVARQLAGGVRSSDLVARTDDRSLSVLLSGVADDEVIDTVSHKVWLIGSEVCRSHAAGLDVAVGVATSRDAVDVSAVRQSVQIAVEHAVASAASPAVARFAPPMRVELERRVAISRSIPAAIENDEFFLEYQPICAVDAGNEVAGVEALVRWDHPELGRLSPDRFITVAERTGLIVDLGTWVLRRALAQLAAWDTAIGTGTVGYVGINVSARQLATGDLPRTVEDALVASALAAERLVVELTESALVGDPDHAAAQLRQLSDLGVRLALDDFGTGWASMSSLQQYPFDLLKIDRSFVGHATPDRRPEMLASMVALGHSLGLTVIAEGVEDAGELAEARSLGVDLVQGWLLGRPMGPEQLVARMVSELRH